MHDNVNYNGPMEAAFGPFAPYEGNSNVIVYIGPAGTDQTKTKACQTVA